MAALTCSRVLPRSGNDIGTSFLFRLRPGRGQRRFARPHATRFLREGACAWTASLVALSMTKGVPGAAHVSSGFPSLQSRAGDYNLRMDASESLSALPAATVGVARPTFLGIEALAALRHRDFRILWLGTLFSSSTIMFQWFAIGRLIENYFPRVLGESFPILLMLGIAGLTRGLGMLIFSVAGGAFADRHDRRNLAIYTQFAALALTGLFALLIALDWIKIWQVFLLLFAVAASQSFDLPARQALIPQLVERSEITNAVSLTTAAMQTSFAFAPLLAGYLLGPLGIAGTYAASLGGPLIMLVALLFIHPRGLENAGPREGILAQIREGVRYSRGDPTVSGILAVSFIISAISIAIIINLSPFWLLRVLDVSTATWGIL